MIFDRVSWPSLLGQDQLVLRRQPQAVGLFTVGDGDFPAGREQLPAVEPVAPERDAAVSRGDPARRVSSVARYIVGSCTHRVELSIVCTCLIVLLRRLRQAPQSTIDVN